MSRLGFCVGAAGRISNGGARDRTGAVRRDSGHVGGASAECARRRATTRRPHTQLPRKAPPIRLVVVRAVEPEAEVCAGGRSFVHGRSTEPRTRRSASTTKVAAHASVVESSSDVSSFHNASKRGARHARGGGGGDDASEQLHADDEAAPHGRRSPTSALRSSAARPPPSRAYPRMDGTLPTTELMELRREKVHDDGRVAEAQAEAEAEAAEVDSFEAPPAAEDEEGAEASGDEDVEGEEDDDGLSTSAAAAGGAGASRKRMTAETKRRISEAMAGKKKSAAMKDKVSRALKGRVPWNKGKSMPTEVRSRMSRARFGRSSWNKGHHLSDEHRRRISARMKGRSVSAETRKRLQMARRRPGDNVIPSSRARDSDRDGAFSLVETEHIHEFVTLRRQLRVWSDAFSERIGRRPSISDVRRLATLDVAEKFERYLRLRDRIRGLAKDVYGSVDPQEIPVEPPKRAHDEGDGAARGTQVTPRVIRVQRSAIGEVIPATGVPFDEEGQAVPYSLSKNDYRLLGQYRLMESNDIHTFIQLRKELKHFSEDYRDRHGHIPALSEMRDAGKLLMVGKFERYLAMRDRMRGLVKEVYGVDMSDVDEIEQVSQQGQRILETLQYAKQPPQGDEALDDHIHDDLLAKDVGERERGAAAAAGGANFEDSVDGGELVGFSGDKDSLLSDETTATHDTTRDDDDLFDSAA